MEDQETHAGEEIQWGANKYNSKETKQIWIW